MKRWLILCLLIVWGLPKLTGQAQFWGKVVDETTGKVVPDATVSIGKNTGTITNTLGEFRLPISSFPILLSISHVSYHPLQKLIQSPLESGLTISLKPVTLQLDEVIIGGGKYTRLMESSLFYVIDYEFIDNKILLIGFSNNQVGLGEISLITQQGKTIVHRRVNRPRKLFKDAFGNTHLFAGDSVYQLLVNSDSIQFLYPTHKDDFSKELLQLKIVNGSSFVFKEIRGDGQANDYYIIDTLRHLRENLYTAYNSGQFRNEQSAMHYRRWNPRFAGKGSIDPGAANALFEAYVLDFFLFHKSIDSDIFQIPDEYLVLDLDSYRMISFNHQGDELGNIPLKIPKHHQREKVILQDAFTSKIYWVFYQGSRILLGQINPDTGTITQTIETPELPMIENIKIRNGTIWFLYQPVIGETVRSLFRLMNSPEFPEFP